MRPFFISSVPASSAARASSPSRALGAALILVLGAASARPAAAVQADTARLAAAVADLEWRSIGPTIMGGRVADIAAVESDPSTFYVGTASGGVWKTLNGGTTFEPVFDDRETASIGDVTVASSNPNVVWVGTGEPQNRQSSPWGNGVYRSLDAGRTWAHMGLAETRHIARIQIHPRDPDVVYVAAVGHLWGPNPDRGVYRTTDGGETWERVLFIDEDTGAIDLSMDPGDPETLFAAAYQRRRTTWGFNGGGPGSGIYRTYDGGDSWEELTEGLPEGDKGRIGLDIHRGDGDLVYAIVEADARAPGQGFGFGGGDRERKSGVYRSTDRGDTWEQLSTTNNRPMYYSQIRVDPNDPDRIYLGGRDLYVSSDGGHEFRDDAADAVHSDHHALWIDPNDSDHLILGGDGGVSASWDRAEHWRQLRNLPIAQFYEIGLDHRDPYHVCGGLQDNGSWCAPSDTRAEWGIRPRHWYNVGTGDGFFTVFHPSDTTTMFAESQGGNLMRVDRITGERKRIRPDDRHLEGAEPAWAPAGSEEEAGGESGQEGDEEPELRWSWDAPVVRSAHDPNTVYIGSNVLLRSTDLGDGWERISPDLTRAIDRRELEIMGVPGSEPMMSPNDGTSSYGELTAIAESPLDADVLYTGSDDGEVHVTRDGGDSWTRLTDRFPDLPGPRYVTRLVASRHDAGTVYAAFDGHRSDDYRPYVYASTDYGETWRRIVDGLPETSVNALAEHPRTAGLLFLGNERGLYASIDRGGHWVRMTGNLPTVPVDDIAIHPRENDLVIGTHGRGIWILDDITALEGLGSDVLASDAHLFPVRRATSYNPYDPQEWAPGIWEAKNPPAGALIRYWVRNDPGGGTGDASPADSADGAGVTVTILDTDGEVVRELEGPGEAGIQQVVWDLRLAPPYEVEGGDFNFFNRPPQGPRVLPGTYTVRLEAAGVRRETPVEIRLDPRVEISEAELTARQEALMDAHRLARPVHEAEETLDGLDERLSEVRSLLEEDGDAPASLGEEVEALQEEVEEIEDELDEADVGGGIVRAIDGSTSRPTEDQLWRIDRAWERIPSLIERLNGVVTERIPTLYDQLHEHDVRPAPGEPVDVPDRGGDG